MNGVDNKPANPPDFQLLASGLDWEFATADTQYLTHNLHRYSGKFIPQIARQAIELLSNPGDTILDTYAGSGTTLLEASLLERHSIGIDLNPLATLIAECKVRPIDPQELDLLLGRFRNLVDGINHPQQTCLFSTELPMSSLSEEAMKDIRFSDDWFRKWFQEDVLKELILIKRHIETISDETCRKLATVAFSDVLRRSSNAHSGFPNVMFDKSASPRPLPSKNFMKNLSTCVSMVKELNQHASLINFPPKVILGDATCLPLEDNSIDAVITHPPYIGAIPYAEYGALSLRWLEFDSKDLDSRLTGGKRQTKDVVLRFQAGYKAMLAESYRVLRPTKKMFIMVGNPVVKGEVIDLGEMTKELANSVGFSLSAETTRNGVNRRANKMGAEILLFFEK